MTSQSAPAISPELAARLERVEADAYTDTLDALSPDFAAAHDVRTWHIGSASVRQFGALNIYIFNAATGIGLGIPATSADVVAISEAFRPSGVTFAFEVSPFAEPATLGQWLIDRGFRHSGNVAKMYRGVEPPLPVTTNVEVRRVDKAQAEEFADTLVKGFQFPPEASLLKDVAMAVVGRHDWNCYVGYYDGKPINVGALYVSGDYCWCGMGATIPEYRGKGGQSAIFAQRIRDAADLGCKWITTDTNEETPEKPNPSYRNMLRMGFALAYMHPTYLFKPERQAAE